MTYEEWLAIDFNLKFLASNAETTASSIGGINGSPSTYLWVNRRTLEEVPAPWLKVDPLTQDEIDNVVLVELETGDIAFSFPPTVVPTSFTPTPTPNLLRGSSRNDTLLGTAQSDELVGLGGSDRLVGKAGDDLLRGGNGNDHLRGGGGNDILWGGKGNNTLVGEAGQDIFVLETGPGGSIIRDFQNGRDKLALEDGIRFRDLRIVQKGNKLLIRLGSDPLATLNGVRKNTITAEDFIQSNS